LSKGEDFCAADLVTRDIVKGFQQKTKLKKRDRGARAAFTEDLLQLAVADAKKRKKDQPLALMLWTYMGAVLRRNEGMMLTKGDWNSKQRNLHVRNDKRNSADSPATKAPGYHKTVYHPKAIQALDYLDEVTPVGGRYFNRGNGCTYNRFREFLKRFPTGMCWFPDLIWDGGHTLRHGGVNWLKQQKHLKQAQSSLRRGCRRCGRSTTTRERMRCGSKKQRRGRGRGSRTVTSPGRTVRRKGRQLGIPGTSSTRKLIGGRGGLL